MNAQLIWKFQKSFIKAIADIKGYDIDSEDDMNNLRLYLNCGKPWWGR